MHLREGSNKTIKNLRYGLKALSNKAKIQEAQKSYHLFQYITHWNLLELHINYLVTASLYSYNTSTLTHSISKALLDQLPSYSMPTSTDLAVATLFYILLIILQQSRVLSMYIIQLHYLVTTHELQCYIVLISAVS